MSKFLQILITILLCTFIPTGVGAVVLYLEPSQGEYQTGDTFIVKIRIDTEDECINTVSVNLGYDKDILKAVDFSRGSSIITFWLKSPEIKQELGLISFSGGIPGGYCGEIPGDPGPSHLFGKLVFQARETDVKPGHETDAKLQFLNTSQVLLNDGFGTPAKLTTQGAVFTILPEKVEPLKNEWQEEMEKDTIAPELFEIEIHQESSIFEGKFFITFSTTDKQTGLDHFEIKEGEGDWKRVESPYLLTDQSLQTIIKVKAVDKAGNERVAEIIPPKRRFPYWIIPIIIVGLIIVGWIIAKLRKTVRETTRKS